MKQIHVPFTVSQRFYRLLQLVARSRDQTVEEYVIDALICDLDCNLQDGGKDGMDTIGLWPFAGFATSEYDYEDQLRAMVSGGAA